MMKPILLLGYYILCSYFLIGVSQSEVISFRLCNNTGSERNATSVVHEVTITPCPEAPEGPCSVIAGQNAKLTVDFTPSVNMTQRTRQGIYWAKAVDVQLKGLPKSVCKKKFLNCTLPENTRRTYTAVIPLKTSFPKKTYDVKAKLYEGRTVHLCVLFQVKLV